MGEANFYYFTCLNLASYFCNLAMVDEEILCNHERFDDLVDNRKFSSSRCKLKNIQSYLRGKKVELKEKLSCARLSEMLLSRTESRWRIKDGGGGVVEMSGKCLFQLAADDLFGEPSSPEESPH